MNDMQANFARIDVELNRQNAALAMQAHQATMQAQTQAINLHMMHHFRACARIVSRDHLAAHLAAFFAAMEKGARQHARALYSDQYHLAA